MSYRIAMENGPGLKMYLTIEHGDIPLLHQPARGYFY